MALFLFILAMTFPIGNVSGFNIPKSDPADQTVTIPENSESASADNGGSYSSIPPVASPLAPVAIPEPATMILLASGLGAMYAFRRKKA